MNCLIVEDEKLAGERLTNLILKIDPSIQVLAITPSVLKTVDWLKSNKQPDLAFMDIQLADGLSFEIFEQIETSFPIIFTTAYDAYALKAFKQNSIDYLLKPIDITELEQAIDKFKLQHINKTGLPPYAIDILMQNLTQKYKNKFVIKVGEHLRIIPTDEVQCFFIIEKAVFLQNQQSRDYALNYSLDQLEELLDPTKFFRISRKYIIYIDAITDIISFSNSRLLLKLKNNSSDDLIVSRERVQKFRHWLEQ